MALGSVPNIRCCQKNLYGVDSVRVRDQPLTQFLYRADGVDGPPEIERN